METEYKVNRDTLYINRNNQIQSWFSIDFAEVEFSRYAIEFD